MDMRAPRVGPWQIFLAFLAQGLTAFGGPVAHLGYFREAFVVRRRWLDEASYADLVALCQFLPGPASSQVGLAIGLRQAGYPGALAAWAGFTLPSALLLMLFALMLTQFSLPAGLVHGLKLVAVAVVAQAVWGMARSLCPDSRRRLLALAATGALIAWPGLAAQLAVIGGAVLIGGWFFRSAAIPAGHSMTPLSHRHGLFWLLLFAILLIGLPVLAAHLADPGLRLFDAFYRAGSLVFGGGHVVLPLLQAEVVTRGWVSAETFLAGYGAAQAVPGPLFTFAAFLGTSAAGWTGGLLALAGIFLPAFLLVAGALPFWEKLRRHARARGVLDAVNAAVVGLLFAAWLNPVCSSALHGASDFAIAGLAMLALMRWQQEPWRVVLCCALAGWVVG